MKQKRKSKNNYRLSNKRLLIVAIGLLVILTLAVANIAYMASYWNNPADQPVTQLMTNEAIARLEAQTATQSQIYTDATQTAEAHEP